MGLWRDSSGRLTFDFSGVAAADYPAMCRRIRDALGLVPASELVIGPDQMFWEFQRGNQQVSLDWDVWMEFMAVAKSEASEPLLQEIVAWLRSIEKKAPESDIIGS